MAMGDDEFQKAVFKRLDRLGEVVEAFRSDTVRRFDRADRRMDAMAARCDDVENRIEAVATRADHVIRQTEQLNMTANEALREARWGRHALFARSAGHAARTSRRGLMQGAVRRPLDDPGA